MCELGGREGGAKRKAHLLPALLAEETLLFMLRHSQGLNPEPTGLSCIPYPVSEVKSAGEGQHGGGQAIGSAASAPGKFQNERLQGIVCAAFRAKVTASDRVHRGL